MKKSGFTLTELLVVICIMAILAALLIPGIAYLREQSNRAKCSSNLRQIGQGFLTFVNENDGRLPQVYYSEAQPNGVTFWYDAICLSLGFPMDAWRRPGIFSCPDSKTLVPNFTMSWEISGMKVARLPGRPSIPVVVSEGDGSSGAGINNSPPFGGLDPKRHGDGANYLFVDGHVEYLKSAPKDALNHLDQW